MTDLWQDSKDTTGLHFKKFSIQFTLHQGLKPAEYNYWACAIKKISKLWRKKFKLSVLVFLGVFWILREYIFSRTSPGRLLLKLIYWNKLITMKRVNIIITSCEYQEQPPKINEKFPRRHLWGGSVTSKMLISHFNLYVFPRVISILSQQLFFKLQQKNLQGWKFAEWKSTLIPQNLLSRMLSIIFSCDHILVSYQV